MEKVFKITKGLTGVPMHYCPGCTHGIVHRLVAEVLEEMDVIESAIGVSSVGCTYNNYDYFACDMLQAAHGRAPAVATGVKRVHPGSLVFTYQGDGDLAAIGTAEIVHAAARGEKITTIFVNNAIYGMTSG
ncbi:MAG: thiamine pyrophosphate-dependent enzyme, partial [Eubacteriales bacterium]|nr:thiamine pyrophosphate-dependent enzyme [Eubacteriales bacterium]